MRHRHTLLLVGLCLSCLAAHAEQPALGAFTAQTGAPRAPEQESVVFEHADLRFKVDPERQQLAGDAALTFQATRPISRLVVDLDPVFAIESVYASSR